MLTILVIILAVGVLGMGIFIILLLRRGAETPRTEEVEITSKAETKAATVGGVEPQASAPQPAPKHRFPKPTIPEDARIEALTAIYSDMPGILGAVIADRFGQTIAADTSLVLDRMAIPAYFMQIIDLARSERLPIGRPKNMLICGEGSYWVLGEIAGMPWGLWFEHEINLQDGTVAADDFRTDLIKAFETNYARIW